MAQGDVAADRKLMVEEVLAQMGERGIQLDDDDLAELEPIKGPADPNELWQAVYDLTGYAVPRVAVCPGHVAPFDVFADVYFERRADVLCIGNRGGGKTTVAGFLHAAKCRWHPEYKSAVAGAVEKQGQRAYAEFKRFTRHIASEIVDSLQSKTDWVNASQFEVMGGTLKQLNGPHPHFAQFDEVELTERPEYEEFQNMAQGDRKHKAQNLLTSTRKTPGGLVQEIVDEIEEALGEGYEPPWDLMIFCVFETMEKVKGCGTTCGCEKVRKGRWADGTPRTFATVCNGRAKKSDGFVQLGDVQKRFRRLSRYTWEAQQECLRPSVEGLVHYWFEHERHVLTKWAPRPEYGSIYRSWDWGGTNPHAVLFHQLLDVPVKVQRVPGEEHTEIVLPEGALITFDEIYVTGGSFRKLAERVFKRTDVWQSYGFDWEVEYDFCDPAGATAKEDVKDVARHSNYKWLVPTFRSIPSKIEDSLEKHVSAGEDDLLYVVGGHCKNMVREYGVYRWPKQKNDKNAPTAPLKKDDHTMDSARYTLWNLYRLGKHQQTEAPDSEFDEHPAQGAHRQREHERRDERSVGGPSEAPASNMSPGYATDDPRRGSAAPSVRRFATPSVKH